MHSRLIITLFLCGWMAAFPMRIGAGGGGPKPESPKLPPLDRVPGMGSTRDSSGYFPPVKTHNFGLNLTPAEWAKRRQQTARQRAKDRQGRARED